MDKTPTILEDKADPPKEVAAKKDQPVLKMAIVTKTVAVKHSRGSSNSGKGIITPTFIRKKSPPGKKETGQQGTPSQHVDEGEEHLFGVKSYLHQFYESVTVKNPQLYEDLYEDSDNSSAMKARRRRRLCVLKACWRLWLFIGALMLLAGIGFLLFGYLMPRREVVAGFQEDMELIDSDAKKFNDFLNLCRVVGLGVFCSGGGVFCLALLASVLVNLQYDEDLRDLTDAYEIVMIPGANYSSEEPSSPTDRKIPATEELSSVQPKRQEEEGVVMTNSGLCKASSSPARDKEE